MSDKERPGFRDAEFLFRDDSAELDVFYVDHIDKEDNVEQSMWHSASSSRSMLPSHQHSPEPLLVDDVNSSKPDVDNQSKRGKGLNPAGGAQRGKRADTSQKRRARLRLRRK